MFFFFFFFFWVYPKLGLHSAERSGNLWFRRDIVLGNPVTLTVELSNPRKRTDPSLGVYIDSGECQNRGADC